MSPTQLFILSQGPERLLMDAIAPLDLSVMSTCVSVESRAGKARSMSPSYPGTHLERLVLLVTDLCLFARSLEAGPSQS